MPDRVITCDTSGTGSGPSSGSGLGPDFIVSVNEAGHHGMSILEKLREQRNSNKFCDVTVQAGGINFLAHRAVLVACSPYFESMLDGTRTKRQTINVQISPSAHTAFDSVLCYMYSGAVSLTEETVADVLRLSERFVMGHLRERCIDFMQSQLSYRSCFRMRDLADGLELTGVIRTIDAFIVANIVEIVENESVLELPISHLEDLLRRTMPLTEISRMTLICRWADHRRDERHKMVSTVLRLYVQWQKVVESSELFHFLRSDISCLGLASFSPSDWCRFQVLQILKDKCLLPDIYFEQLARLQDQYASFVSDDCQPEGIQEDTETTLLPNCNVIVSITCGDVDDDEHQDAPDVGGAAEDDLCTSDVQHIKSVKSRRKKSSNTSLQKAVLATAGVGATTATNILQMDNTERRQLRKRAVPSASVLSPRKQKHIGICDSQNAVVVVQDDCNIESVPADSSVSHEIGIPAKRKSLRHIAAEADDLHLSEVENQQPVDVCNAGESGLNSNESVNSPPSIVHTHKKEKRKRTVQILCKVKCKHCGYIVRSEDKLNVHIKTAHTDKRKFSCNICKYETGWNREFYRHMRANHFPGPPHLCDLCPFTSDSIPHLVLHRMDHTDERPYSCTTCGVRFKLKSNLASHKRCHSGDKPFKCVHCDRSFTTKGTLEQHVVTHSSQRPYLCDLCGFSTKFQSHLISHRRIHTGEVYKCQYAGCTYSTPKRSQLACHARSVHLHVRSHVCTECGRAFIERSHLVRHERLHLSDKPFACEDCPYVSTRRDKLKEHRAKRHGDGCIDNVKQAKRPRRKGAKKTIDLSVDQQVVTDALASTVNDGTTSCVPSNTVSCTNTTMMLPLQLVVRHQNTDDQLVLTDCNNISLVAGNGDNTSTPGVLNSVQQSATTFDPSGGTPSLGVDAYRLIVGNAVDGGTVLLTTCNLDSGRVDDLSRNQLTSESADANCQSNGGGVCSSLWIVTQ